MTVNYAIEQRLRMIDFLVENFGHLRRYHLMFDYGIGEAQASRDIKRYRDFAPDNLVFDDSSKCWLKGKNFKRVF